MCRSELSGSATLFEEDPCRADGGDVIWLTASNSPGIVRCLVRSVAALALLALTPCALDGQMQLVWSIYNVAGNASTSYSGDGGLATAAGIAYPGGVGVDTAGNVYMADASAHRIRKINAATGVITTIAGTGSPGFYGDGGPATSAMLSFPTGLAVDTAGNIYFADTNNYRVREIVAATGKIVTLAGNGLPLSLGDGLWATLASVNFPTGIALDGAGNVYVTETNGQRIRKVNLSSGIITTVAGSGILGFNADGIDARLAYLSSPSGIAFDLAGNLYISDDGNQRVRKVSAQSGVISTLAGNGTQGYSGDGGRATSAQLHTPYGLAVDDAGNLFIADAYNHAIRKVSIATGTISTVAGNGTAGSSGNGGAAINAQLNTPNDMTMDAFGTLYIADTGNHRVRRLGLNTSFAQIAVGATSLKRTFLMQTTYAESISSIAAVTSAGGVKELTVGAVTGCVVDGTTINATNTTCSVPVTFSPAYPGQRLIPLKIATSKGSISFGMAGIGSSGLAQLTPGIISTYAGNGAGDYKGDGGAALSASLNGPRQLAFDISGNLYIADQANNVVRRVTPQGVISTFAGNGTNGFSGDGGAATNAQLNGPSALVVDMAGNLYIADAGNNRVRVVNGNSGIVSTYAGNGNSGSSGDGNAAVSASLDKPGGLASDSNGDIYIAESGGSRVRKVNTVAGTILTVAGTGANGYSGDGGAATSARLNTPAGLATDAQDNLYIADPGSQVVRKVTHATGVITTVAGNGSQGRSGDGGAACRATDGSSAGASLNGPEAVAVDAAGSIYIADRGNHQVRRVLGGVIATVAGEGSQGNTGDGGIATSATLDEPSGIALDAVGNMYISAHGSNVVRKVSVANSVLRFPTSTAYRTVDSADGPQSLRVANAGNGALTVSTPVSGTNPSLALNFIFQGSTTCPVLTSADGAQPIAAGRECVYAIDFYPTAVGSISGTMLLTDNSLNAVSAVQSVSLQASSSSASTATTLSSSVNPSEVSAAVVFSAAVAPVSGNGVPSGTVQFSVDGNVLCPAAALNTNAVATCSTSTLARGTHSVSAVYSSDVDAFVGSTAPTLPQTVQQGSSTIVLSTSNPAVNYGTPVTLTASLPSVVTGLVSFRDGATLIGTATATAGTAAISTSSLATGTHSLVASYAGSADYAAATSAAVTQTVSRSAVTIVLNSSRNPSLFGDRVTVTATFTGAGVAPTGTAILKDGNLSLGTLTLDSAGHATFTSSSLGSGAHTLGVTYNGDVNYY